MFDWSGTSQNELTVIRRTEEYQGGSPKYLCKCTCGNKCLKSARDLAGGAFACGNCGYKITDEYSILNGIRQRCNNPNNAAYRHYGGRGITVCVRWNGRMRESYLNFIEDIGKRPSKLHSIDRIDVNGGYEPANCRWATAAEQYNNKRPNARAGIILTGRDYYDIFMSTEPYSTICARYGISRQLVDNLRGGYYSKIAYNSIATVMNIPIPVTFKQLKFARLKLRISQQVSN